MVIEWLNNIVGDFIGLYGFELIVVVALIFLIILIFSKR